MHTSGSGRASSTYFRHSMVNVKTGPNSYEYWQKGGGDIYVNIEMQPIFTPSKQWSLKMFSRQLQQSLKDPQIQQIMQNHNNQNAKIMQNGQLCPKNIAHSSQKILIIDDRNGFRGKSLFSSIKNTNSSKKYSLDMKDKTLKQRNPIFQIHSIQADPLEEIQMLRELITSENSKGLIARLMRKKKAAQEQQEKSNCLFRYPLNRRIFNKLSKNCHSIKGSKFVINIQQANPQSQQMVEQKLQRQIIYKRAIRYRNKNLLSPPKTKQQSKQVRPYFNLANKKIFRYQTDAEEIGPWKQDLNGSFDI